MRFLSILRPSGKKCLGTGKFREVSETAIRNVRNLVSNSKFIWCPLHLDVSVATFFTISRCWFGVDSVLIPVDSYCVCGARSRASRARRPSRRRIWTAWSGASRAGRRARRGDSDTMAEGAQQAQQVDFRLNSWSFRKHGIRIRFRDSEPWQIAAASVFVVRDFFMPRPVTTHRLWAKPSVACRHLAAGSAGSAGSAGCAGSPDLSRTSVGHGTAYGQPMTALLITFWCCSSCIWLTRPNFLHWLHH